MIDTSYETGRALGYSDSVQMYESDGHSRDFLWLAGGFILFLTGLGVALIWLFTMAVHETRLKVSVASNKDNGVLVAKHH